jgi:hypothetical protein
MTVGKTVRDISAVTIIKPVRIHATQRWVTVPAGHALEVHGVRGKEENC